MVVHIHNTQTEPLSPKGGVYTALIFMAIKSRGIKIDEEACDVYMVGGGGGGGRGRPSICSLQKL